MDSVIRDIRYALRSWTKRPGSTLLIIATLAIGIGANAAVFSIVDGVLLRPLGYDAADELVVIRTELPRQSAVLPRSGGPEMLDIIERSSFFESLGGVWARPAALTDDANEPEEIEMGFVTADFLTTLGVAPALGRLVEADDDLPNAAPVIVLSHGLWQRRYGARRDIVGATIEMDGEPLEVVGVMPEVFGMWMPKDAGIGEHLEAWVPWGGGYDELSRRFRVLTLVGRLRAGASLPTARAELDAVADSILTDHPEEYERSGLKLHLAPLLDDVTAAVRPALVALWSTVALVLLIACANVGNLLLVRATGMEREVALRRALGASAGQLFRQLMTETSLLAAAGGALGLLLAGWGARALSALAPAELPRASAIGIDGRVLAVTALVTLLAGIVVGVVSAFHLSRSEGGVTRSGRSIDESGRHRLRRVLVATEVAVSLVLLVVAGLLLQSFTALSRTDLGLSTTNVWTAKLSLIDSAYPYSGPEKIMGFYRSLLQSLSDDPGIDVVGASTQLPLDGNASRLAPYAYDTETGPLEWDTVAADYRTVTPGFLEAIGVPLIAGRSFAWTDDAEHPPVVIVDEHLARAAWPARSAIGQRLRVMRRKNGLPTPEWCEVIGVVGHVRNHPGLDGSAQVFLPHSQNPLRTMTLAVRTEGSRDDLAVSIRAAVRALEPSQPVHSILPMDHYKALALSQNEYTSMGLGAFAVVALALSSLGVYGVIAFGVSRRDREIGIRLALGATPAGIRKSVFRDGAALVAPGLVVGILAALGFARVFESLLYGVSATDPATFLFVLAVLAMVSALASYLPARRAAAADPASALRGQ